MVSPGRAGRTKDWNFFLFTNWNPDVRRVLEGTAEAFIVAQPGVTDGVGAVRSLTSM